MNSKDIKSKKKPSRFTNLVEDVVGSEFVGMIDMVEVANLQFELGLELRAATLQYLRDTSSDYDQTIGSIAQSKSPVDLMSTLNSHVEQRLFHGINFAESIMDAVLSEQKKVMETHIALWSPFFNILGKDFRISTSA
jgi:hypothetical protein